jgi:hypothetical protein
MVDRRTTPRPAVKQPRGIGTLIGNGWLREAPKNHWPREWDVRGRSALRKCLFLPLPEHLRNLPIPPEPNRVPAPPPRPRRNTPMQPHRHDPRKDARMFPAVHPHHAKHNQHLEPTHKKREPRQWFEDPLAIGSFLILCPPIGLAIVWRSKHYSSDARWALTVMTALTMCLSAAVMIAAIALR